VIRSAVIADAHSITALWNDLIRETAVTFTTELKVCSDVEAMIMDPGRSVFICEQEGVFEGFALFGAFRGGPGYAHTVEHSIYLVPEAQGKGLGRALMVGAISGGNANAVAFHEKCGFTQAGHLPEVGRKNAVWHDLILMHLILETPTDTSERKG
jgi:L-amino acid N-acyltransferase YncA